jgi:hypothetical protein
VKGGDGGIGQGRGWGMEIFRQGEEGALLRGIGGSVVKRRTQEGAGRSATAPSMGINIMPRVFRLN